VVGSEYQTSWQQKLRHLFFRTSALPTDDVTACNCLRTGALAVAVLGVVRASDLDIYVVAVRGNESLCVVTA